MISLIGKTVRVNSEFDVKFFYPDFVVRNGRFGAEGSLSIADYGSRVIYTGPQNRKALSILSSCEYIATMGMPQYDLTDREQKIKFVFSKWDREVPKNVLDNIDYYDDDEFDYCCKVFWTCARWPYKIDSEQSIYDLFLSSVESEDKMVEAFYKALKTFHVGVVEQSFFTFMLRAKDVDAQNVSATYKRLLKQFYNTSGSKMRKAMLSYVQSPIENRELKFVEFLYNLR